jgi:hypothetical protein
LPIPIWGSPRSSPTFPGWTQNWRCASPRRPYLRCSRHPTPPCGHPRRPYLCRRHPMLHLRHHMAPMCYQMSTTIFLSTAGKLLERTNTTRIEAVGCRRQQQNGGGFQSTMAPAFRHPWAVQWPDGSTTCLQTWPPACPLPLCLRRGVDCTEYWRIMWTYFRHPMKTKRVWW